MMTQLRIFGRYVACAPGLLALFMTASCAATSDPEPTMGNTNWLSACDTDDDCGDGLSCECGVCTRVCTTSADCDGLGAVCDPGSDALLAACGAGSTAALCLPACERDRECGGDQSCVDDHCILTSIVHAADGGPCPGDGCQANDAGSDSGSSGDGDGDGDGDAGTDGGLACQGPNPEGCFSRGCPSGQRCDTSGDECVSSGCVCDSTTGSYVCTPDCSGGTCVALEPVDCGGSLTFADPVLEELVRVTIAKPSGEIVAADVASLTDLTNDGAGVDGAVTSLEGIQCLTSLSSITIRFGQLTDLTPLAALEDLRFLTLNAHPDLSDLSSLAQLSALEGVFITDTLVEDVSPLAGLSQVTEIALEGNRIRDIRPLQGLAALELLWLLDNPLDCALNEEAITSLEGIGVNVDAPQCD